MFPTCDPDVDVRLVGDVVSPATRVASPVLYGQFPDPESPAE